MARRAEIDERLAAWTRARPPRTVTAALQDAGVPAGFMQRAEDYPADPHLQARDFFRMLEQPGLEPIMVDNMPFRSERVPEPAAAPAPALGEHTREVCLELLGMEPGEVDRLLACGALEEPVPVSPATGAGPSTGSPGPRRRRRCPPARTRGPGPTA